ncbi:hypothetical protein CAI21_21700 [Alkalilimnicola ehrlichii]|uniref:hypothetical protein n=1 Tax=Alkalilimnicola ehrlichii TaxID=351052 RepID=UPI000E2F5184|nr:hypothetical protein [Alkalilimnicola ehrlichii]RFA24440.1 hypothetical protein CAI21_21700 [Alkalilimnicola ehrlichii]
MRPAPETVSGLFYAQKYTDEQILDAYNETGTKAGAARRLGMDERNLKRRLKVLLGEDQEQEVDASPMELDELRSQVRSLTAELRTARKDELTQRKVRREIFNLSEQSSEPPQWLVRTGGLSKSPGVPTLFASDWHWAEHVTPSEIGGVNEYTLPIAHKRARQMVERAIDLLTNHMVNPDYPGIVFALGGDMVTGDIHEELSVTNELEIMPTVMDLSGVLIWCIQELADAFGRVFVPCVTGNHGRNTKKIRNKGRNHTSFDWLIYVMLERHFQSDDRIKFYIPDGPDALYQVYGHRYLLTHGDQFRGGDGMIGALGPILRGDHKKRSRNNQIDMGFDTMLLGHWHQLIQLQRVIVNGSLKGYDEYAYSNNFGFEPPQQALWITHPQHGITFSMPVHVDEPRKVKGTDWVSWKAA